MQDTALRKPPGSVSSSPHAPATILLVEDDLAICELILECLQSRGHHVIACSSAEHARRTMPNLPCPPELLITDIRLTGLSGADLAVIMRRHQPRLPVLFMSGVTRSSANLHECLAGPHTEFIEKPFSLRTFSALVETMVPLARPAA
jgi:two-component system, cell cycle sensor histidine kinase and response regulator CckA